MLLHQTSHQKTEPLSLSLRDRPLFLSPRTVRGSTDTLSGTTATVRPSANQESMGLRPASSESGPTGLRAFITILSSTDKQERESRQRQAGLGTGCRGRARGGGTPDDNCSANADKQDDSDSDPGNGSRTQAVLRC